MLAGVLAVATSAVCMMPSASYAATTNILLGDANGDGAMNIADAAAVVQALGNKDKYGLTAQGEFNADVDGNGLTGADALAIQIMVAEAGMPE